MTVENLLSNHKQSRVIRRALHQINNSSRMAEKTNQSVLMSPVMRSMFLTHCIYVSQAKLAKILEFHYRHIQYYFEMLGVVGSVCLVHMSPIAVFSAQIGTPILWNRQFVIIYLLRSHESAMHNTMLFGLTAVVQRNSRHVYKASVAPRQRYRTT